MLFHCVLQTTHPLDFQGSSLMPLFMMLTGFSISVTYGRSRWRHPGPCCGRPVAASVPGELEPAAAKPFPTWSFYRNRFARVYPVYLVALALAAPLWPLGYGVAPYDPKAFLALCLESLTLVSSFLTTPNIVGRKCVPVLG